MIQLLDKYCKEYQKSLWWILPTTIGGIVYVNIYNPEFNAMVSQYNESSAVWFRVLTSLLAFVMLMGWSFIISVASTTYLELVKATLKLIAFEAAAQAKKYIRIFWEGFKELLTTLLVLWNLIISEPNWGVTSTASLFFRNHLPYNLYPLSCIQLE
ncbi:MAG: hypothetical protein KDE51_25515 [Anaerolineales bacterium]|nr:hypothetical protein [Anaerolineales bacterium]